MLGIKRATEPIILKTIVTLLAVTILYWEQLYLLFNDAWNNEYSNYILVVPLFILYLLYRSRKYIKAAASDPPKPTIWGNIPISEALATFLLLTGYIMKMYASYTFDPLGYQMFSMVVFAIGAVTLLFGFTTLKALIAPLGFLLFLIPPPFVTIQQIGAYLSYYSGKASYLFLSSVGIAAEWLQEYGTPVIIVNKLGVGIITFSLDVACSGVYSMLGFLLFSIFVATIAHGPLWKKILVLALGFPLLYILNVLRITIIILVGYLIDTELVLTIFHYTSGLVLVTIGTFLLMLLSEKILKVKFFEKTKNNCTHTPTSANLPYCPECGKLLRPPTKTLTVTQGVVMLGLLTLVILASLTQVPTFTLVAGDRELLIQQSLTSNKTIAILPEINGYKLSLLYRDTYFEKKAGQDASLMYLYTSLDQRDPVFVGMEIASSKGPLHPWEVCLVTYPEELGQTVQAQALDLRDTHILDNPPISARYFAYKPTAKSNETDVVLYWYTESIFNTNQGYQKKWIKISVIGYTMNPEEYQTVENNILPMAEAIINYHQPITNWSWLALLIGRIGPSLIGACIFITLATMCLILFRDMLERKNIRQLLTRITDKDDQLILSTLKAIKSGATENQIKKKYEESSGKQIDPVTLHDKLQRAEEAGLIKQSISEIDNEPHLLWHSNY